mgnify:CR=1 FL=1
MTVHAEDIAGTERGRLLQAVAAVLTGKGTPGSLSKCMGKLGGRRDIAVTVGDRRTLGMQGIVQRPAEVARAIQTGIAVLVPAAGRVVAVRGIAVAAVGIAGVLTVEKVNPALRQANVHSGVAGAGILLVLIPFPVTTPALLGLVIIGFGCAPVYPAIIHSTPFYFGKENSQALIGIQMAFAYVGSTFMPPLLGTLAARIGIWLYPVFLLVFEVLMVLTSEKLNRIQNGSGTE